MRLLHPTPHIGDATCYISLYWEYVRRGAQLDSLGRETSRETRETRQKPADPPATRRAISPAAPVPVTKQVRTSSMLTAVTPIVPSYTVGEAGGSSVEHQLPATLREQLCAQVGGPAHPEIWRAAVALVGHSIHQTAEMPLLPWIENIKHSETPD
jgi:hypothetical protein